MITEFRKIIFCKEEIVNAILAYNRKSTSKLPVGDIVAVTLKNNPEPTLELEIYDALESKKETISLKSSYLAAAMLRHCMNQNIPLPRNATKHFEIVGDSVALSLSLNASPKQVFDPQP